MRTKRFSHRKIPVVSTELALTHIFMEIFRALLTVLLPEDLPLLYMVEDQACSHHAQPRDHKGGKDLVIKGRLVCLTQQRRLKMVLIVGEDVDDEIQIIICIISQVMEVKYFLNIVL